MRAGDVSSPAYAKPPNKNEVLLRFAVALVKEFRIETHGCGQACETGCEPHTEAPAILFQIARRFPESRLRAARPRFSRGSTIVTDVPCV